MAQNIKLKRSSVAGKVPTVAQLEAGELAINTADGKLYFERDDSTIQSIVTTNALITGSLNLSGPITGSDVNISDWGSISASLSAIQSGASTVTLQEVTDNGSTTTNAITAPSFTGSLSGTASYASFAATAATASISDFVNILSTSLPNTYYVTFNGGTGYQTQLLNGSMEYRANTDTLVVTNISSSGLITGSDVVIDDWGSVSASLATIQSGANTVTLQDVTDNGNTTTNDIYISSSKSLYLGANSYIRREQNGGGNENIQLNGSVRLNPNTSANANNGVVIGGNGYLLAPNSSRNAQLNYGSVSGQLGVYRLNVYGADSTFQYGVAITGSLGVTGGITGSDVRIDQWGSVSASLASVGNNTVSSSYALSASHAETADLATTAINTSYAQNITVTGKNLSGGTIAKGTPLYFTGSGTAGNLVGIYPADAGNPARMPAGGVAGESIADQAEGLVLINGYINGVDTSGFTPGTEVFVAAGGGYTATVPTGSALIQKLGNVEKSDNSNGSGVINGPGAARSVPNIASGFTWVGAGNGVATPTAVSSLSVASAVSASYAATASALNTLNQNLTIVGNLEVFGTSSFTSVTSSQLIVDDSFISVNVFEPAERFGGLKVYDSGSLSHLATASLAWDSTRNHWVYQNASGSSYTGGMLMAGPRNTGSLGDEPALTKWYVARSDGGDHLENTQIYSSGSQTDITGSLTTTGKVTINTVDNYGADPDKFLAIVNGEVVYRTGAQVLSDIGGQTSGTFVQNSGAGGTARYIMRYADSNSATTSSMYEDTSGNIGINTAVPSARLDVNGNAVVSGSLQVLSGITGSLLGSASTATSASYAATASYVDLSAGNYVSTYSTTGADNRIAVYRDVNTIEGDSDFTYDGTSLRVNQSQMRYGQSLGSTSGKLSFPVGSGVSADGFTADYVITSGSGAGKVGYRAGHIIAAFGINGANPVLTETQTNTIGSMPNIVTAVSASGTDMYLTFEWSGGSSIYSKVNVFTLGL